MHVAWSVAYQTGTKGASRSWAVLVCPRCAGATLLRFELSNWSGTPGNPIASNQSTQVVEQHPAAGGAQSEITHLPDDVAEFYDSAIRVLAAGVPDAAAVQLRKTLEAAVAHVGVQGKSLYESVEQLIEEGLITRSFSGLLTHVRKIGNIGAHYTDARLDQEEVERALAFTSQVLRNLFEVPGELERLGTEATPSPLK